VSLPEVSVAAADPGPVVVQAGEAGRSSVTRLDEVLTAPDISAGQVPEHRRGEPALRRQATAQAFMLAGLIVLAHGGRAVLVNPRELAREVLNRSRAAEMFTVGTRHRLRPHRRAAWTAGSARGPCR
jgi:hypothetical protein